MQALLENAIGGVVEDHEDRVDAIVRGRPQPLAGIHRAAVADEPDHRPLGERELDANGGREPPADAAAAQAEIALRVVAADELADAGGGRERLFDDDRVLRQRLSDGMQQRQRLHRCRLRERAGFGGEGVAFGGDRLRCSREPLARRAACAAGQAFAHGGRDVRQRGLRIAEDGDRRRIVLAELPGIDVEMDQLDRGRHRIDVGGQRQGEKIAADREQHVVLIEHLAHVGRQPDHGAAEQRMRGGKRRRARHEFGIDRRAEEFRELDQFGVRAALRDGVAGHDQRALGIGEQGGGRFDRGAIPAQARRDARGSGEVDVSVGAQDVAG